MTNERFRMLFVSLSIVLAVFLLEAVSVVPHYVDEYATVRKVVKETGWGYIGTDCVTIGRFDDGGYAEWGGDFGEPGERVLMPRLRGTASLFGLFGNYLR